MATDKRKKTVTYKQVTFHNKGPNLKLILDAALKKLDAVEDRRQSLAPEGETPIWRLIADFKIETAMTFGVLFQYVPNTNPRLLIDDPKAKMLKVEQFTTPNTEDGKRREPFEGVLYFATYDDHLVFLQSSALRSSHLEQHLAWLLHKSGELEGTNQLMLIDKPPNAVVKKLSSHKVKTLEVGGELLPVSTFQCVDTVATAASRPQASKTSTLATTAQSNNSGIISALKGLLRPDEAAKLDLEALAGSNIEYTLKVTYKGGTTDNGQKLMDTLGVALRHSDDLHTKISLVGGGSITNDEIKLSGPVTLDFHNGEPSKDDVYEAMRTWLLEKLTSGIVKG
jgi:hypothetical protein